MSNASRFKKITRVFLAVFFLLALSFTTHAEAQEQELVILDSDMVELFDDGVAMLMLSRSPNVQLLGVTVTTGNTWNKAGAANAIRQLEAVGRTDIPVILGETPQRIKDRFAVIKEEYKRFGRGHDVDYAGAADFPEPSDWKSFYMESFGEEPTAVPLYGSEDFIIQTIRENPGKVTIAAIGPATNIAAAIEKDPGIVPLAKRIVYMAGAFFQPGNTTPAAELNAWVDPPSLKKVMRAPWKEQVFFPLDVCERMVLSAKDFQTMKKNTDRPIFKNMMKRHYLNEYLSDPKKHTYIWDIMVAAYIIDPTILEKEVIMPVDVNDVYSPSYGQTLAYEGYGPDGTQSAHIVLKVNQEKILSMVHSLFKEYL